MIINKQVRLDEIEIGDLIVIKDNHKREECRKQVYKVINLQKIKYFEILAENKEGTRTFTTDDVYAVAKISF